MWHFVDLASAQPEFLLRQDNDAAPFGGFICQRRELGRSGHLLPGHARSRQKRSSLAVAQRDRARLVQQQHVHVASGLDGAPAHREHILLHETVNAGNADGAEQSANRGRDEANEQGNEHGDREINSSEEAERLQRDQHYQEDNRERGEQNRQRDFIRRLLPLGAFNQADHAIQKCFARV